MFSFEILLDPEDVEMENENPGMVHRVSLHDSKDLSMLLYTVAGQAQQPVYRYSLLPIAKSMYRLPYSNHIHTQTRQAQTEWVECIVLTYSS